MNTHALISMEKIDQKQKKIIKPNEPPYVPTQDEIEGKKEIARKNQRQEKHLQSHKSSPNGLAEMIKKMVNMRQW